MTERRTGSSPRTAPISIPRRPSQGSLGLLQRRPDLAPLESPRWRKRGLTSALSAGIICRPSNRGGSEMAITESIEIGRPPQDVFAYVSDMARHPE